MVSIRSGTLKSSPKRPSDPQKVPHFWEPPAFRIGDRTQGLLVVLNLLISKFHRWAVGPLLKVCTI